MTNTPEYIKQEYRDSGYRGSLSEYLVVQAKIDALLTSPSMTAAQDFQGIFDVIISINTDAQGLNQRMQAIARERKPKAIFFYMDKKIRRYLTMMDISPMPARYLHFCQEKTTRRT